MSEITVNIRKWSTGEQPVDYFRSNGNVVSGDNFALDTEGLYTVYTKYSDGNEYLQKLNVTKENLNVPKLYTDTTLGVVTVAYAIKHERIYGIKIDTTSSSPVNSLTYTDHAVGLTPASGNNGSFNYGSWADKFPFNQIKPCLLKNGLVNYYLNPNDFTKKMDGTNADITSGNDGDVMIEFPKIYWKFETVGTDLYIKYSDTKIDNTYVCYAHMRGSTENDKTYVSAYIGTMLNGKLRSLSGKDLNIAEGQEKSLSAYRTIIRSSGVGYEHLTHHQLTMTKLLFLIMFKNKNSQRALGMGLTTMPYSDPTGMALTGGTNQKGMFYGEDTGKQQMKFCGIEDLWGNQNCFFDGLFAHEGTEAFTTTIKIGNTDYNNTGSGYVFGGTFYDSALMGTLKNIAGMKEAVGGFAPYSVLSSGHNNEIEYCDSVTFFQNRAYYMGGRFDDLTSAGLFATEGIGIDTSVWYVNARLSYY